VPFQPDGWPAKANDPATWATLWEAFRALESGRYAGLGFVLGDGIAGVDLDWKEWEGDGVPPEALAIVERLASYTEWSPSGKGCHVLLKGKLPEGSANQKKGLAPGVHLEAYDGGRFFTFTGKRWEGYPHDLEERQEALEALARELLRREPQEAPSPPRGGPLELTDAELLERMFSSANGAHLRALWAGEWRALGYPSQSEADLALAGALMWWTGNDFACADRLFRQSGLYRKKWDERHARDGRTYGQLTLERAVAANPYEPGRPRVVRVRVGGEASPGEGGVHPLDGLVGGGEVMGHPRYLVKGGAIHAARVEGKGEARAVTYWPLANFAAVITREVKATYGDGVDPETLFELEGYLANGRPLPLARVRGGEFPGMAWVTREWGASVVITPGQGAKDHLRAAIQFLSFGRTKYATIYRHLGWTRIGGAWVYLHARGGIGAEGVVEGLEVEPGRALEGFQLPAPPEGPEEARAIEELWGLLSVFPSGSNSVFPSGSNSVFPSGSNRVAPARITAPLLLYALTAPLGHTPFTLYLAGPSGARKTSLALVIQSLWGHHTTPPLGWEATPNALEAAAFAAKDTLLLVDDYAPQSSEGKQKELQAKAARLLRSQGNATGRLRMRADGSLTGDKPPRGAILATGEDLPPGHSVRARTLFLEVARGDVDLKALSEAQRKAAEGRYALAMSAWVRWLAGRLEEVQAWLPRRVEELRPHYAAEHGRHTDAAARLHATWELYRRYAAERGVDLAGLEAEVLQALQEAAREQAAYLRDADPAERFVELLQTALRMGRAHLLPLGWKPGEAIEGYMEDPAAWGWKWREPASASEFAKGVWEPQGAAIGWLPEDPEARGVYLDPKAAYAILARLASERLL
jgi:hypothetical protein